MNSKPNEIHIGISDSSSTASQLEEFTAQLFAYFKTKFPSAQAFIARRTDCDRPIYAAADGEPAPALSLQVLRLYAKFVISAEFAAGA